MRSLTGFCPCPKTERGQFVWCFTADPGDESWYERRLWQIDVPTDSVLAYVDNRIWEHLIGSDVVPTDLRRQWCCQGLSNEEISAKVQEYHEKCFPSRKECVEALLSPTAPARTFWLLVPVPFAESWICSYCPPPGGTPWKRRR